MYVAGMPYHVIQRGNNRDACFFSDSDYLFYLTCLQEACTRYQVSCHAYVLMTNHTHLLLSPKTENGVSAVMQSLGRRYVQSINKLYRRSGTLWEGRHKASVVDAENYLLSCYRYIELNPVVARMTIHPGDYRWSSYRNHAYGEPNTIIVDHSVFENLGNNSKLRHENYRALFDTVLSKTILHEIRNAAECSMPLGNSRFKNQIEQTTQRSIGYSQRGRPRKT